ncbi:DsbA family protein [Ancylobacter pratisalsi]|uniref:DsbA family protein n=1 Tax=Ancylobacter pratisalsi TaxID=1745854 RepID=A0A6P1YN49_9HYPH|nr:DsbA family protein [Ancylobacter pratisalsi]QIB34808.1 DsbA family protein [Ancylobacter pratisalsi]
MHRRALLRSALGVSLAATLIAAPGANKSQLAGRTLDVEALLFDPEAPVGGNPKGDVTVVAFFDYNCGYCRRSMPELERLVREDGGIRLVYKDWPILAKSSVTTAQLALAAKYQDKYEAAHKALMELGGRASADRIDAALTKAGVDGKILAADLKKHAREIGALLGRNDEQAEALELPGTPVYLVGPFKVAAALDYDGFRDVVQDARNRAAGK